LNDQPAQVLFSASNQINFVVPPKLSPGLATLKLNNGSTIAPQLLVEIDPAPPAISLITNAGGQALDTGHVASSGDVIVATVTGVDPSVIGSTSRVRAFVSGVEMAVLQISAGSDKNTVQVAFLVGQSFGGLGVPVVVSVDGTRSSPYSIVVK